MAQSSSASLPPIISTFKLFRKSFLFIKQNSKNIFYIILIMLIPRLIIQTIRLVVFYQFDGGLALSDSWTIFFFWFIPALNIISIIVYFLGSIALLIFINEDDPDFRVSSAFKTGFRKFFSSLWITIIYGLITIGGIILFVIPGIFWAVIYGLGIYILIAEDLKGYKALRRSKELIKNYWWPVFLKNINLFLFIIFAAFPLLIIESIIKSEIILLIDFGYEIIYSLFIIAIVTVYSFYIYKDLKRIKG